MSYTKIDDTEETDKDQGCPETRRYWIAEDLSTLSETARWTALRRIGLVERECCTEDCHEDCHTAERLVL